METTSYLGSFVKLPSNQNCTLESQSGNIKTRKCPTQTTDNKMFLCGKMGGNLTVKLNYCRWKVYFSAFYLMNLKALWYISIKTNIPVNHLFVNKFTFERFCSLGHLHYCCIVSLKENHLCDLTCKLTSNNMECLSEKCV